MRHEHVRGAPGPATKSASTSTATKPNDTVIFAHVADVDRQARERRARALLRAAEQLAHRYPESARLARLWAGEGR